MLNDNPLVSISILTFNRCSLLKKLLIELGELTYTSLEIIVVDNHSEDQTRKMMELNFPKIKYISIPENIGAAARNVGMRAAKGEIIITLDDDVNDLRDREIQILVNKFSQNIDLGAVTFRYINMEGHTCTWVHHCKEEDYYDKEFTTYEILEGAVAFRKKALDFAGYYPENFFLSHEGPDLAFRILEKGFRVIYTGQVSVKHSLGKGGPKSMEKLLLRYPKSVLARCP